MICKLTGLELHAMSCLILNCVCGGGICVCYATPGNSNNTEQLEMLDTGFTALCTVSLRNSYYKCFRNADSLVSFLCTETHMYRPFQQFNMWTKHLVQQDFRHSTPQVSPGLTWDFVSKTQLVLLFFFLIKQVLPILGVRTQSLQYGFVLLNNVFFDLVFV